MSADCRSNATLVGHPTEIASLNLAHANADVLGMAVRGSGRDFKQMLLSGVVWPYQQSFLNPEACRQPPAMERSRSISKPYSFHSNKMNRAVDCESKTELRFFQHLDKVQSVLYFQEQFGSIPYRSNGRRRKYHPDGLVALTDGRSFLVEVKHDVDLVAYNTLRKLEAMLQACEASGYGAFVGNECRTLREIAAHEPRQKLIRAFATALKSGPIEKQHFKFLKTRLRADTIEADAALLEMNLVVKMAPLRISRPTNEEAAILNSLKRWLMSDTRSQQPTKAKAVEFPNSSFKRAASRIERSSSSARSRIAPVDRSGKRGG